MTAISLYSEIKPTEEVISCCLQIKAEWKSRPMHPYTYFILMVDPKDWVNTPCSSYLLSVLIVLHLIICLLKYLFTCLFTIHVQMKQELWLPSHLKSRSQLTYLWFSKRQ